MPSRDPGVRFGDIVREIDLIKEFIGGRSAALVSSDEVSFDRLWQTVQIHLDSLYSECLAQIAPHARRRMPKKSD